MQTEMPDELKELFDREGLLRNGKLMGVPLKYMNLVKSYLDQEEWERCISTKAVYDSSCTNCGAHKFGAELGFKSLQECGGCLIVQYCGPACQKAHWNSHKEGCREVRARRKDPDSQPSPVDRMSLVNIEDKARSFFKYYGQAIREYINHELPCTPAASPAAHKKWCLQMKLLPSSAWNDKSRQAKAAFTLQEIAFVAIDSLPTDAWFQVTMQRARVEADPSFQARSAGLLIVPVVLCIQRGWREGSGSSYAYHNAYDAMAIDLQTRRRRWERKGSCSAKWYRKFSVLVNKQEGVSVGDVLCSCQDMEVA